MDLYPRLLEDEQIVCSYGQPLSYPAMTWLGHSLANFLPLLCTVGDDQGRCENGYHLSSRVCQITGAEEWK